MGTNGSPHGGTPAMESHARPDGCGGHHLRFCEKGLDRYAIGAYLCSGPRYLARSFRTGTKPIWQSGLSRSTYPFPQDLKRSPVRTLLTASLNRGTTSVRTLLTTSLNRGATPWEWTEGPHGGTPTRENHARSNWLWRPLIKILWERISRTT